MLKRVPPKLVIGVLLFLFAFAFYLSHGFGRANLYQARDLHRALGLLDGNLIWYGPDLTGGGRLPGAFFYWLMAIPLAISATLEAAHVFLFALTALAAVLLWSYLGSAYSRSVGFAGYFLFLNSAFIRENVQAFWNPTYLFPFLVAAFGLWLGSRFVSRRRLVVFGILCGLMLQIHGTTLVLVFAGAVTILRTTDRDMKERLQLLAVFAVATLVPLIPFSVWRSTLEATVTSFDDGRQGFQSFLFPFVKTAHLWRSSLSSLPDRFSSVLDAFIGGDLFLVCAVGATLGSRSKPFSGRRFFKIAFVLAACLVPWVFFEASYSRYAIPFVLLAIIAMAIGTAPVVERRPLFFAIPLVIYYMIAIATLPLTQLKTEFSSPLVLALFASAVVSSFLFAGKAGARSWRRGAFMGVLFTATVANAIIGREVSETGALVTTKEGPEFAEMKDILSFVADRTHVPYDFVREHTVFLGLDRETDLSFLYEQVLSETSKVDSAKLPGGIIIAGKPAGLDLAKHADAMPEVIAALAKDEIFCRSIKETKSYVTCIYEFRDPAIGGKWNNIGYPYRFIEPRPAQIAGKSGLVSQTERQATFFATECQRPDPSCYVYFRMTIGDGRLRILAYGDPIGMPDAAPNPAWVLTLRNVRLDVTCDGVPTETISFATRLGFNRVRDSFLAPYEKVVNLPCPEPSMIELILDEGESIFLGLRTHPLVPYRFVWERTP